MPGWRCKVAAARAEISPKRWGLRHGCGAVPLACVCKLPNSLIGVKRLLNSLTRVIRLPVISPAVWGSSAHLTRFTWGREAPSLQFCHTINRKYLQHPYKLSLLAYSRSFYNSTFFSITTLMPSTFHSLTHALGFVYPQLPRQYGLRLTSFI